MLQAGIIAIIVVICMYLCMFVPSCIFGTTKKVFIASTILCIIVLIWTKIFGIWNGQKIFWSLLGVVGGIVWFYFLTKKHLVDFICPNCGAWEEYNKIKLISKDSWQSLDNVEVERKIYNKDHEEIGSFTDTKQELQWHYKKTWIIECKKCGKRGYLTE